jgi:FixJ family two-component response regulator
MAAFRMRGPSAPPSGPEATSGRVFLVDDDDSVRQALTRLLRAAGLDVAAFPSAADFLAADLPDRGPRCLVVDLRMPGQSGLDLQEALRRRMTEVPVVFISGAADLESGVRAMKGGALDFLPKPLSPPVLLEAIRRALDLDGQRRADRAERETLEARLRSLTPREREVFALVASGLANKQVGSDLGAAETTIKIHRGRVMEKMQAASLADLVRMADKLGLTGGVPEGPSAGPPRPPGDLAARK